MEKSRSEYEFTINTMRIRIDTLETDLMEKTSFILSLEEIIAKKVDVER